jgi:Fe-S cluster assembly protein SufD
MNTVALIPNWLATCIDAQQAEQPWLRELQAVQGQAFLERGIPSRREEFWKYTDVSFLGKRNFNLASQKINPEEFAEFADLQRIKNSANIFIVLVNGNFVEKLSDTRHLPHEVKLCSMSEALKNQVDLIRPYLSDMANVDRHPFLSLNLALMHDGVFLYIPKNMSVPVPIHLLYINTENNSVTNPRNLIIADENSEATLLEDYSTPHTANYFTNVVTTIHTASHARINYHKIQDESSEATHIADTFINQKKSSTVKYTALATGSRLARENIFVALNETGAECSVNGFYNLNHDNQHIDNHIQIDHAAPHGTSDMMYKGILDKNSHGVFNGKIYVHPGAQKTLSRQANHNLLLSADAAIDTKPEFEIYADDVKCSHGDTVGQLQTESLFYLRSRGIDRHTALKLLAYAFAADVMKRINNPAIAQRMNKLLNEKLSDDS